MQIMSIAAAVFFGIAAADLLTGGHLGLGDALKEGLGVIVELLLLMTGFMALSPWIAVHIAPHVTPLLESAGCDPSLLAGILFSCDAGGAYLAKQIAVDPAAGLYNGLIVSSFFGTAVTGAVPLSLSNTAGRQRKAAVKGLSIAFITLPLNCLITGSFCGMPMDMMLRNTWPIMILSLILLAGLLFLPQIMVPVFSGLAFAVRTAAYLSFAIAVFQDAGGPVILEGLTPLDEIYPVIVRIGVFLGGILPIFALIQRMLKKPLERLAEKVQLSPKSISYLILSTSNDIPVLMNLKELEDDGITVNVAYLMAAAYTIGDFLAFSIQFAPKLAFPMMFGRLVSGFLMIVICLLKPVRSHAKQPAPVFSR